MSSRCHHTILLKYKCALPPAASGCYPMRVLGIPICIGTER